MRRLAHEPHAPTDDLRRKAIALVERWLRRWPRHGGIRADRKRLDNAVARIVSSTTQMCLHRLVEHGVMIHRMSGRHRWHVVAVVGMLMATSTDTGTQALPDAFLRS